MDEFAMSDGRSGEGAETEVRRPLKTIRIPPPPFQREHKTERRAIKTIRLPGLMRGSAQSASPLSTIKFRPLRRDTLTPA